MSFLIFDVDHSLASIGGAPGAAKVSAIQPIRITNNRAYILKIKSLLKRRYLFKYLSNIRDLTKRSRN